MTMFYYFRSADEENRNLINVQRGGMGAGQFADDTDDAGDKTGNDYEETGDFGAKVRNRFDHAESGNVNGGEEEHRDAE